MLCASFVYMLFSSKLVIVVVNLKEVCEFIITYTCGGIFQKWGPRSYWTPQTNKSLGPGPLIPGLDGYACVYTNRITQRLYDTARHGVCKQLSHLTPWLGLTLTLANVLMNVGLIWPQTTFHVP